MSVTAKFDLQTVPTSDWTGRAAGATYRFTCDTEAELPTLAQGVIEGDNAYCGDTNRRWICSGGAWIIRTKDNIANAIQMTQGTTVSIGSWPDGQFAVRSGNTIIGGALATVATTGSYTDLTSRPTLATVATSGAYSDLSGKPSIPAAQVQSDWTAVSGIGVILNKPTLTSGTVTSIIAGTGLSGGTITSTGTISLPNTGTAGTYTGNLVTDAQGRVTSGTIRSFSTPTFSGITTAAQISTTRDAEVFYDIDASVSVSLLAGQSVTATLKYADNSGMSTNPVTVSSQQTNSSGVLGLAQTNTLKLLGQIPAGKYRQVTFAVTGTGTATPAALKAGQEVLL